MLKAATSPAHRDSVLPLLPPHDFRVGEKVSMPIFPSGTIQGTVQHIDVLWRGRRYAGLVVVDGDGCCYELRPQIAKRTP
jgi:hypothetical protein